MLAVTDEKSQNEKESVDSSMSSCLQFSFMDEKGEGNYEKVV